MSDDSSSDDAFFDVLEELGGEPVVLKAEDSVIPRASPRTSPRTSPRVVPRELPTSDDEVKIPSVFLAHGPRNSRLLAKSKEIARQLTEDEKKTSEKLNHLQQLRNAFLHELNDNGSQITYTQKNAASMIDTLVEKYHTKDIDLYLKRHYYCFSDVSSVHLDVSHSLDPLLLSVIHGDRLFASTIGGNLLKMGFSRSDIVDWFLANCYSVEELQFGVAMTEDLPSGGTPSENLPSGETPSEIIPNRKNPEIRFNKLFAAIGGNPPGTCLPLKLVHYNTNPQLTVLRLRLVMIEGYNMQEDKFIEHFIRAVSDFTLNKEARELLRGEVVRPVMERLAQSPTAAETLQRALGKIETRAPQDTHPYTNKNGEIIGNFVHHVHEAMKDGPGRQLANQLVRGFLFGKAATESEDISPEEATAVVGTISRVHVGAEHVTQIMCNSSKASMCSTILTKHIYYGTNQRQWVAELKRQLHLSKDELQEKIGTCARVTPSICRTILTYGLSEIYHELERLGQVLDKNVVFYQADPFYGP